MKGFPSNWFPASRDSSGNPVHNGCAFGGPVVCTAVLPPTQNCAQEVAGNGDAMLKKPWGQASCRQLMELRTIACTGSQ